eukprot:SAG31_NODE_53_length_30139_cov_31.002197_25_plen_46_part_00
MHVSHACVSLSLQSVVDAVMEDGNMLLHCAGALMIEHPARFCPHS